MSCTSAVFLVSSLFLVLSSIYPALAAGSTRVCNNSPLLCDRGYGEITHLGAHDSPFVRNASTGYSVSGDQYYFSTTQLSAGVRLLSGQVHSYKTLTGQTQWHLCHSYCELYDAGTLAGWLTGIKGWLDHNKNDVVTILLVNADNATASELHQQFESADIVDYAYTPAEKTQPISKWPTLNQLIDMDKRLVVFIASLDPKSNSVAPYLLNEFTYIFENNYDIDNRHDFSCTANRPPQYANHTQSALSSGLVPLMNHFLYRKITSSIEIPAAGQTRHTNAPNGSVGNFGDAADHCTHVYGRAPTFTLVDFFNNGPAIETVDGLNGVQGHISGREKIPQGRPPPVLESSASSMA